MYCIYQNVVSTLTIKMNIMSLLIMIVIINIVGANSTYSAMENSISNEDFPIILNATSSYVYLTDTNFTKTKEIVFIQLTAKCLEFWCEKSNEINTNLTAFTSLKPINNKKRIDIGLSYPFSTYNITINLCTLDKRDYCRAKSYTIITLPDKPHSISQLTVYSIDKNYIRIKWRPPYPPTGILEKYKIKYKKEKNFLRNFLPNIHSIIVPVKTCGIWHDWHCAELTSSIKERKTYKIQVSAKNKFIDKFSGIESVNAYTEKQSSSPPSSNFTIIDSTNNSLILSWEHPFTTNGDLKQFDIEIKNEEQKIEETYLIPNRKYNLTYSHSINSSKLLPSKYYNIRISANNGIKGQSTPMQIYSSPPGIPKFEKINFVNTNNSIELKATLSLIEDSKLYVLKSTKSTKHKSWDDFPDLDKYVQSLGFENYDIITKCKITRKDVVMTLENDRVICDQNCLAINSIEILPEESCSFIVIVENTFNNKSSYKWYKNEMTVINNDNKVAFYAVIVIVITATIIICIYLLNKWVKKRHSARLIKNVNNKASTTSIASTTINIRQFTSESRQARNSHHVYEEIDLVSVHDDKNVKNNTTLENTDEDDYNIFVNTEEENQVTMLNSK